MNERVHGRMAAKLPQVSGLQCITDPLRGAHFDHLG